MGLDGPLLRMSWAMTWDSITTSTATYLATRSMLAASWSPGAPAPLTDPRGPSNYVYSLFQPVPGQAELMPTLGPMTSGANSLIYGFDSQAYLDATVEPVVSPYLYFDLMSYCNELVPDGKADGKDKWPSSVTYSNLLNEMSAAFGPPVTVPLGGPRSKGEGNYLFVRGVVDFIAGTAQFLPCIALSMSTPPPGPLAGTNFLLQALDTSGAVLQAVPFGLNPSVAEQGDTNLTSDFIVPLTADPAMHTLRALAQWGAVGLAHRQPPPAHAHAHRAERRAETSPPAPSWWPGPGTTWTGIC